jgi:predicted enzyme related to lactoylglutathione lyase
MAAPVHAINFFEIPVADFDRAKRFYETIMGYGMKERESGTGRMAFFEHDIDNEGRGGAIVYDPAFYTPSSNGTLIYLNCEPDIQKVLDKVEDAGGKILQARMPVAMTQDMGYWALIMDSEGNRIALHSMEE